jgi:cob(I)alamin adenosyltransferase
MKRGYIQVYTGNGKGKTTSAIGLCIRAAGWGYRSIIIQFMKGREYGELKTINNYLYKYIHIQQFGRSNFVYDSPTDEDIRLAKEGLEVAYKSFQHDYDIVVLDELNVAYYFGLVGKEDIIRVIDSKPSSVELIITGRYAPHFILERADLITEMREVKHYYKKGILARKGIEE